MSSYLSFKFFCCCGIQRKRFSSVVGYNRRVFSVVGYDREVFPPLWHTTEGFFPLWDTMEEVFFHCGIQWRKMIQCRVIFINFESLSLPSNRNIGKISCFNSQTNHLKKLKMENYMVTHENIFFPLWDTLQQRFF